uniref:Uncharacterized protein n=1 Tax=Anguilla anguilla TaxID=7936 RepID=A0A0E9RE50_ANGAN
MSSLWSVPIGTFVEMYFLPGRMPLKSVNYSSRQGSSTTSFWWPGTFKK